MLLSRSGIIYGTYCFSSWLAPPLVLRLGPRWSMVLAAASYVFQVSPCLHRNTVYCTVLYCTGVPVPLPQHRHCLPRRRAARLRRPHHLDCPGQLQQSFLLSQSQPLCCVQGTFLTRNSDSATITRNSGIFWAILKTSGLIGNMAAFFLFRDQEILQRRTWVLLGAVLTAVSGLGTVLLLLLRKCSPEF